MTPLDSVAVQAVVAERVVRHTLNHAKPLTTHLPGARDSVVPGRRNAWLAIQRRIAHLSPRAPQSVVTASGIRKMQHLPDGFVAEIQRAHDPVVHGHGDPRSATQKRIAVLPAVAPQPVVAIGVRG
jgi:hypothetical protein